MWARRGFEVPSCITDGGILHECHASSLSCLLVPAEDKFSAFRKPNQYATAVLEKVSLLYEMKTSPRRSCVCVCVCARVCVCVVMLQNVKRAPTGAE